MSRFYRVLVEPTLLGIATRRVWGRLGRPGREMIEHHASAGAAEVAGAKLIASKLKRGYRPASAFSLKHAKPVASAAGRAKRLPRISSHLSERTVFT